METQYGNGGELPSITRLERKYANASTHDVTQAFEKRWALAGRLVTTLLGDVESVIGDEGAYPLVPQTIVGIVTSLFGFTPSSAPVETELLHKAEALPSLLMFGKETAGIR